MPLGNFFLEVRESYFAVRGEYDIFGIHLDLQDPRILQILEIRILLLFYLLAFQPDFLVWFLLFSLRAGASIPIH